MNLPTSVLYAPPLSLFLLPSLYCSCYADAPQITDPNRSLYAAYGLGVSNWAHVLAPSALSSVFQLRNNGISNRPTESGSRWQTSGTYGIGADGLVKWGGPAGRADDIPDFEEGVREVGM